MACTRLPDYRGLFYNTKEEQAMAHAAQPHRVRSARYVSDFTRFMDGFLEDYPETVADGRRGWGIWWERLVDQQEGVVADTLPRPPYSYD